jgi:hypothetical protein
MYTVIAKNEAGKYEVFRSDIETMAMARNVKSHIPEFMVALIVPACLVSKALELNNK